MPFIKLEFLSNHAIGANYNRSGTFALAFPFILPFFDDLSSCECGEKGESLIFKYKLTSDINKSEQIGEWEEKNIDEYVSTVQEHWKTTLKWTLINDPITLSQWERTNTYIHTQLCLIADKILDNFLKFSPVPEGI